MTTDTHWFFEHVVYPVLGIVAAALAGFIMKFLQNSIWDEGSCCPRLVNDIEKSIVFSPRQNALKSALEFGDVAVASKPLLGLQQDVIRQLYGESGGMLGVCAPQGDGKSSTVLGLALSRYKGMPARVLCFSPGTAAGQLTSKDYMDWVNKQACGPEPTGLDAAAYILAALMKPMLYTMKLKRYPIKFLGNRTGFDVLPPAKNYGMLVLEDFNPVELEGRDKDALSPFELTQLLNNDAWSQFCTFAQKAHNNQVIVVVTTSNMNVLRLIHDINSGKSCMAPFTSNHVDPNTVASVENNWIGGLGWDAGSKYDLLVGKFPALQSHQDLTFLNALANNPQKNIRQCCSAVRETYIGRAGERNRKNRKIWCFLRDFCVKSWCVLHDYGFEPLKRHLCWNSVRWCLECNGAAPMDEHNRYHRHSDTSSVV